MRGLAWTYHQLGPQWLVGISCQRGEHIDAIALLRVGQLAAHDRGESRNQIQAA